MTEEHPTAHKATAEALFTQWSPHRDLSKPYLLEKTPITLTRTRLFHALFPKAYFLVLIRHPAAVALATYNALASSGKVPDLTLTDLIENWVSAYETLARDAPYLKHYTLVRYEDFARMPQETINGIYRFLGLPTYPCGEPIRADADALYRQQWWAMSRDPRHREDIKRATSFEERIRQWGYSLQEWQDAEPPADAAASLILETERLVLRPFTFGDVDDLAALCADAETMRFWGGIHAREKTWGEIRGYLSGYKQSGHSFWAVVDKSDGRLVGRCGLYPPERGNQQEAELGYQIARPYWGRGLGTEAALAVKDYSFANGPFRRLISMIDPTNTGSLRVAQKIGMSYEQATGSEDGAFHVYAVNNSL